MTHSSRPSKYKIISIIFFSLVALSLLAPLFVFKDLLFPYVTSKAFYFRILIELALPFYVYLLLVRPDLRPRWRKAYLHWLMLAFLLLNLVSAMFGDEVTRSLWGNFERMGGVYYLGHLTLLYFYVVMIAQMGGNYLKRFLQMVLLVALAVTVNGIFGKLGWPMLVQDPSLPGRVSSTLGNPIYLGSFLVLPLFLGLFLGVQEEGSLAKRWGYYFCSFLFLVGILLSGTRGAMVGLVAGVFLSAAAYFILSPNRKVKLYGFGAVGIFALAGALLFMFSSKLPQGSDFRRLFTLRDSNTEARLIQWGVALKGYKEHPWLGVGPENYYVISDKYYNPAIFPYDPSWFDKPHNYLLEILVTEGLFAFIAYLAMLAAMVWALYRAYKAGYFGLFEFSALLGGLLVYQIQNLTVFDTVPASLMFYSFVGFTGYLWNVSFAGAKKDKSGLKKLGPSFGQALPLAAFGVAAAVAAYLIYATNVVPMEISRAVNYGYAYAGVDPAKADAYFQRAVNLPFNFDQTETADRYADFAVNLARAAAPQNQDQVNKILNEVIAASNNASVAQPNYPILWERLAEVYLFTGVQDGKVVSVNPNAEEAINKAIQFAPNREEAYLTLAQIRGFEGNLPAAEQILTGIVKTFPTDARTKIQLATLYRAENKLPQAIEITEEAQAQGYIFSSPADFEWMVNYYIAQKDYGKALTLLKLGNSMAPDDMAVLAALAKVYALTGQSQQAINAAQQVMQTDPTKAKDMQALIDSLTTATSTGK